MTTGKNILLIITGSIAAFKIASLVSSLKKLNHNVKVVATPAALNFVGAATWEGLSGNPVQSETFQTGEMMNHIHLQRWADLILTAPATANTLNQMASGHGDTLATALFLAHDFQKPWLVAPAMNTKMWEHPATQKSLQQLTTWGVKILGTGEGQLACGETGDGRMLEPGQILNILLQEMSPTALTQRPRVLVTMGGTSEPLDEVRVITNRSTGQTGASLAKAFAAAGAAVTVLRAKNTVGPENVQRELQFESFADLSDLLEVEMKQRWDIVIHSAAVSDFSVEPFQGKISSDQMPELKWKRNQKLVEKLRGWAGSHPTQIVAFKMTSTQDQRAQQSAVDKLQAGSDANYIVHNDTHELSWGSARHQFRLLQPHQDLAKAPVLQGRDALAAALLSKLLPGIQKNELDREQEGPLL